MSVNQLRLPFDVLECVIEQLAILTRAPGALRYRLVSKAFDDRILRALLTYNLLSEERFYESFSTIPESVQDSFIEFVAHYISSIPRHHLTLPWDRNACSFYHFIVDELLSLESEDAQLAGEGEKCRLVASLVKSSLGTWTRPMHNIFKYMDPTSGPLPFVANAPTFELLFAALLLNKPVGVFNKILARHPTHLGPINFNSRSFIVDITNLFNEAASRGSLPATTALMDSPITHSNFHWDYSRAIHCALNNGHESVARIMFWHPRFSEFSKTFGHHELDGAAKHGFTELLLEFMSAGAVFKAPSWGGGALPEFAARHGHADTVKMLLDHRVKYHAPVIMLWAARSGSAETIRALLEAGWPHPKSFSAKCTAATWAWALLFAIHGRDADPVVEYILSLSPETFNMSLLLEEQLDPLLNGLCYACATGQVNVVKMLARAGVPLHGPVYADTRVDPSPGGWISEARLYGIEVELPAIGVSEDVEIPVFGVPYGARADRPGVVSENLPMLLAFATKNNALVSVLQDYGCPPISGISAEELKPEKFAPGLINAEEGRWRTVTEDAPNMRWFKFE